MDKIVVDCLTKDYGHGRGVFDVSFKIAEGECFGFLGPNGAGKSTTIRHLMGFSKPDSGKAQILGMDSFDCYDKFMDKVGYLPGEIALPSGLTGYQFIDMMKKLKGVKDDSWLNYLMELFELDPRGDCKRMSNGIKRKLAIVTAFLNDPDILILDEPTSGLDLAMQQTFISFIKKEKERGKTILLSSHIFGEVDATCDRIAIIKDGHIVNIFHTDELKHASEKIYQITFKDDKEKQKFVKNEGKNSIFSLKNDENEAIILTIDDKDINKLIKILAKYDFVDFEHLKTSLQDYFMKFYKEDASYGGIE